MTDKTTHDQEQELPDYFRQNDGERSSMLLDLLRQHSSRRVLERTAEDHGFAENLPFPFMALVGQVEMRMALLLSIINPNVGGVLLVGPRGIGKTTAARGLSDLLPLVPQSTCEFGCLPEDYEAQGAWGVCEVCAEKLENDETITRMEPVRLVELPLNAGIEDVVGGVNERAAIQSNLVRLDRGILSRSDRNILYIDEVNLLPNVIVDAILDAAAQGHYTVRRGAIRATYRSRFVLIGSMNPEEGNLRPQILDRFGLRVLVTGLQDPDERLMVYERALQFKQNPRAFIEAFGDETYLAREDVSIARDLLPSVQLTEEAKRFGMALVDALQIHSHRAEFSMFEAARAHAALDQRDAATEDDIHAIAALALRMRRSEFIDDFIVGQAKQDETLDDLITKLKAG